MRCGQASLWVLFVSTFVPCAQSQQNPPTRGGQSSTQQQQAEGLALHPPSPPMPLAVALSGRVIMQDGTLPSALVTVRAICNGVPSSRTPLDSQGRFVVQVTGRPGRVIAPASSSSSRGDARQSLTKGAQIHCSITIRGPGVRPWTNEVINSRPMESPRLGLIVLSRAGMEMPPDAQKAYLKGKEEAQKQDWDKAQAQFEKAVAVYPKYAGAWYELGEVYEREKRPEDASKAYRQAVAADPKYGNPYLRLAALAAQEQKWQEVSGWSSQLIKLNSLDFPAAYYFHMLANFNLHNLAVAEQSARQTLKRDQEHRFPKAHHLLGLILANQGDNAAAREQLRDYLKFAPGGMDKALVMKQLAEVERRLVLAPTAGPAQGQ